MYINVQKLVVEIESYNKLLEVYEEILFKFYNELDQVEQYWKGSRANYFFYNIEEEKRMVNIFFNDLKSISSFFSFLLEKHQKIGKNIFVDLKNKDYIFNKFNSYLNKVEDLISCYKNLNVDFEQQIKNILSEQLIDLQVSKEKLSFIKDRYKNYFFEIEEYEMQMKDKLSKIVLGEIKPNTTQLKSFGSVVNSYIDTNQVQICFKKINLYKKEEDIILKKIMINLQKIISIYNFSSKNILCNIELEISNKFRIILSNHENEIIILKNEVDIAKDKINQINQNFENLS